MVVVLEKHTNILKRERGKLIDDVIRKMVRNHEKIKDFYNKLKKNYILLIIVIYNITYKYDLFIE